MTFTGCKNRGRGPGRAEASRTQRGKPSCSVHFIWGTEPELSLGIEQLRRNLPRIINWAPQHKDTSHCAPSCYLSPSSGRTKAQRLFLSLLDIKKQCKPRGQVIYKRIHILQQSSNIQKAETKGPYNPSHANIHTKTVFIYAASQG